MIVIPTAAFKELKNILSKAISLPSCRYQSSVFIFLLRAHGIKSTLAHSQALKCESIAEAAGKTSVGGVLGGGAPVAG